MAVNALESTSPRIVFCDVDGTLLTSDHRVLPGTVGAIRALERRNIPFVIVSARSPGGIRPILKTYGFRCPMICFSGAFALDAQGAELYSKGFSVEEARRVIAFLEKNRLDCAWNLYSRETWLVKDKSDPRIQREERIVQAQAIEGSPALLPLDADVGKILCICRPESLPAIEERMKAAFPALSIARSSNILLEIMPGGVNKSMAVRTLCALWRIPLSAALAFGDHYNDVEMLETVGTPFLMGNAPEELKQRFPRVTDSNDQDGIAHALNALGLG